MERLLLDIAREEFATRESRRIEVALRTAKLMPVKALESLDFSFQSSLDRERIAALAQLDFIRSAEVVHFLGPPGTGKSHLATALGVAAVKAGRSFYRATLAELIDGLARAL
ncbi:ATP-binding protein [Rhodovulum tesquicola]|uniref:ATP-binding protein n=1 Tax=Rhodovulum tesquicola TaxID=540254 RepID=UPI0025B76BCE|nr:ATP-binding protein [Rhodovulum tesquicola]